MSLLVQELFLTMVETSGSRLHIYGQANAGRQDMKDMKDQAGAGRSLIKAYGPWVQGEDFIAYI